MSSAVKAEKPPDHRDRFLGPLAVLTGFALAGVSAVVAAGLLLGTFALGDVLLALGVSTGILASILLERLERSRRLRRPSLAAASPRVSPDALGARRDEAPDDEQRRAPESTKGNDEQADDEQADDDELSVQSESRTAAASAGRPQSNDGALAGGAPSERGRSAPDATTREALAESAAKRKGGKAETVPRTSAGPGRSTPPSKTVSRHVSRKPRLISASASVRMGTAGVGLALSAVIAFTDPSRPLASAALVGATAAACLVGAALAAVASRYLAEVEPTELLQAPGLARGARVLAWTFVLAAAMLGLAWVGLPKIVSAIHFTLVAAIGAVCLGLDPWNRSARPGESSFPMDLAIWTLFGNRMNPAASVLDFAERHLGIDLRSTWALTVVRRGAPPLAFALATVGWLMTGLTVVRPSENAIVERFGVPVAGTLGPGLHAHWPWPVDHVFRVPVKTVQRIGVGHEGEEDGGPENVLWARQHAANEYTLLLGDGRDLITIDAAVQYRISDARAWRYGCQNPADALRAIAYRAVMRATVDRTLTDALSENVVSLTREMQAAVQRDADALGLGVEIVSFTVGGMHPPVAVSPDYQSVVSAELGKRTARVEAEAYRNQHVLAAEAAVVRGRNATEASAAEARATAKGEAASFRAVEAPYTAYPEEYMFRRRLEGLEKGLTAGSLTILDYRIERDGGVLWLKP